MECLHILHLHAMSNEQLVLPEPEHFISAIKL